MIRMFKPMLIPIGGLVLLGLFVLGAVSFFGVKPGPSDRPASPPSQNSQTEVSTPNSVRVRPYSENAVESEAEVKVLFFQTSWCPTCRVLREDIAEHEADVPRDWLILEVDYDANVSLREEYEVNAPHTLIYLDAQNNAFAKWSALLTLEDVIAAAEIQ